MSGIKQGEDFNTEGVKCVLLLVILGLCFNMFESYCFSCSSGFRREVHRLKIRVWGKSEDKGKAYGILAERSEENTFDF